ncbi:MAG TPA: amidohydrolase family protein [Bradyrhizobium sp.]|jgi:aminocarboxymuconate-semialdehyde decarboxylase
MPQTIDSHTHILTEEAMRLLARESPKVAPVLKGRSTPQATLEVDGKVVQDPMPSEIWDVDLRLRDMDANDVDVQVLSPTVFTFYYGQEPALALACAAIQNEEIATVVKRNPDRFIGLGSVPLQAPELAAKELRRSMTTHGLRGAMIGTNVNGRNLDDPALAPFWAAAEELGAFLFIHPHGGIFGERLGSYYMKNFVGLPFDTTIAAASLVFGGVLERYPRLKICLSHGGGYVPYQAGRFQHAYDVRPEAKAHLPNGPGASLGRLYYDTILHSKPALEFLISSAGPDRVLLGSDYPFDMGNLDCVARVRALSIESDTRDLILGGYARTVLGGP